MRGYHHGRGNKIQVQSYIDLKTFETLKEWIDEWGYPISAVVRAAIKAGFENQDDLYKQLEDEKNEI